MTLTEWEPQFEIKALAALTVVPAGSIGIGGQGTFDLSAPGVTTSVNPSTREVTITDAPVLMDSLAASVLNAVFPNGSPSRTTTSRAGTCSGICRCT